MQSLPPKKFIIHGVDKCTASRLMAKNYTSVNTELSDQYSTLKTVNGVGGFAAADVISVLGIGYEARLSEAGITNVTVPQEISKKFGYRHSVVLIDVEQLHRLSVAKTFTFNSNSPPGTR